MIFYHILIKDPSKAFDGDYKEADYNQVMTTIDEFNKITETMYEKGYVMVSIYDMAKADADGNITEGEILLPEGKIPFVLLRTMSVIIIIWMVMDMHRSWLLMRMEKSGTNI